MDASDVPVWVQQLGGLVGTVGVAAALAFNERRKSRRSDPDPQPGGSDAQVVAASFVERRQMDALTSAVTGLHGELVVVTGHLAKLNDRAHESEIVAAAVAKIREERL